jgi:hypothetical protein
MLEAPVEARKHICEAHGCRPEGVKRVTAAGRKADPKKCLRQFSSATARFEAFKRIREGRSVNW